MPNDGARFGQRFGGFHDYCAKYCGGYVHFFGKTRQTRQARYQIRFRHNARGANFTKKLTSINGNTVTKSEDLTYFCDKFNGFLPHHSFKFFNKLIKMHNRMKKIILISLIISTQILRGLSQNVTITLTPSIVNANVSLDSFEIKAKAIFKNTATTTKKFVWKRTIIAMTNGWQSLVCDAKGCWSSTVNDAPEQIELAPNTSSNIDAYIRPNKITGAATIEIKVFEVGNETNAVTGRYLFSSSTPTKEVSKNNASVKIFPNPATDYFSIQDDYDAVDRVVVYNMIGRVMKNYAVNSTTTKYTLNDLPEGLYIIRLLNARGGTVKTVRLNKARAKA
jgi:Secretion system C-terminal sorting domain